MRECLGLFLLRADLISTGPDSDQQRCVAFVTGLLLNSPYDSNVTARTMIKAEAYGYLKIQISVEWTHLCVPHR